MLRCQYGNIFVAQFRVVVDLPAALGPALYFFAKMPSSQLKRLKVSLREQGIIGPQQSKKQKKKNAQDAQAKGDKRLRRTAALEEIRDSFNPFQFKMNARGPKFPVTSNRPQSESAARGIKGRPGVALSLSEERVSRTILTSSGACY